MKTQLPKRIVQLLWNGGEPGDFRAMFWSGALVWGIFSVFNLLVNGVILDQVVIPAQIISGLVKYPPGHPHQVFYPQAYNLPNLLAAGVLKVYANPYFIAAFRNLFFLFLSTFIPFAFTLILTRRPFWGHLAAVISVFGVTNFLAGVYPLRVIPQFYSDGHIGLYFSLLVVALLLAGEWAIGGLMLGLLPAVHLSMAILILPWSTIFMFFVWQSLQPRLRRRFILMLGSGLLICLLTAGVFLLQPEVTALFPYNIHLNGEIIRTNFRITTDSHRQLFSIRTAGYLLNLVVFLSIGGLLLASTQSKSGPHAQASFPSRKLIVKSILLLGGMAWLIVFGARILHVVLGELPLVIDIPMPYRFSNYSAVLLLPLTLGVIAEVYDRINENARAALIGLCLGILALLFVKILSGTIHPEQYTLHLLWGLTFSAVFYSYSGHLKKMVLPFVAFLLTGIALFLTGIRSSFLLAYLLSFFGALIIFYTVDWMNQKYIIRWAAIHQLNLSLLLLACICLPSIATLKFYNEAWLPEVNRWYLVSEFDKELQNWLKNNSEPGEMILSSIVPRTELQAKTGHPVLFELETLWLMTYMPELAPTIGGMVADLYGIDYLDLQQIEGLCRQDPTGGLCNGNQLNTFSPIWLLAWSQRNTAEWQALGQKYGFRLVVAPTVVPLDLPVVLSAEGKSLIDGLTLYEIPPQP